MGSSPDGGNDPRADSPDLPALTPGFYFAVQAGGDFLIDFIIQCVRRGAGRSPCAADNDAPIAILTRTPRPLARSTHSRSSLPRPARPIHLAIPRPRTASLCPRSRASLPTSHRLASLGALRTSDPHDKPLLEELATSQGDYILTANTVGEYSFCFENEASLTGKVIDFELRSPLCPAPRAFRWPWSPEPSPSKGRISLFSG